MMAVLVGLLAVAAAVVTCLCVSIAWRYPRRKACGLVAALSALMLVRMVASWALEMTGRWEGGGGLGGLLYLVIQVLVPVTGFILLGALALVLAWEESWGE